jgi:CheY-like chemotaxis protein
MSDRPRILIVDDDRDLVAVERLVLEREGYRVSDAPGPAEGLAKAETERPDMILLDVMMPSATEGFHFVWKLRNRPGSYFAEVPIVIVSAIHDKTELRFYPDGGDGTYNAGEFLPVQDFLDKPVDPADLLRAVRRALGLVPQG